MNIRLSALVFVVLSTITACDLFNKTTAQATARHVMVSTLIGTPAITISPAALAGFDASIPDFDAGGFPFDAGGFDAGTLLGDGGLTLPAQTAAMVYFGQLKSSDLSQAPEAILGAIATLAPAGGASITLKDQGSGTHQLTSVEEPTLKYQPGVTWTFTTTAEGQTYVADVENIPDVERIAAFHPAAGFLELPANAEYTFARPDPATGAERNLGFVSVFPINVGSGSGLGAQPTWTNMPTKPLEFLKLVAAPGDWKKTTVVIPGSAFPEANHNYAIVLQSAKLGGAKSENLFIGSAVIAGTADVAIVKTR